MLEIQTFLQNANIVSASSYWWMFK